MSATEQTGIGGVSICTDSVSGKIRGKRRRATGRCIKCSAYIPTHGGRIYCKECRDEKDRLLVFAVRAVRKEIASGRLPHPKHLVCADCGLPASCYDHRSYDAPTTVSAVCRSCNARRGPATWVTERFFLPPIPHSRPPLTATSDAFDCAAATLMGAA